MAEGALSIKLRCASWQQLATIYKRDLSQGTMFLKSASPPALGTSVRIDLSLPSATVITLTGVVHRHLSDPQRGPGIELALAPIPAGTVWLIESALASEHKRMATPYQGVPALGAHQVTGMIPTIGEITEAADVAAAEQDLIKALMAEAESLKKLNPFLVLGVGYEATDSEVRAAFGDLTKRYHPDRFARYESPELRQVAAEIFILIRDAYRRLADAPSRASLLASLGKQHSASRAMPAPPRAPQTIPPPRATQRVPTTPKPPTKPPPLAPPPLAAAPPVAIPPPPTAPLAAAAPVASPRPPATPPGAEVRRYARAASVDPSALPLPPPPPPDSRAALRSPPAGSPVVPPPIDPRAPTRTPSAGSPIVPPPIDPRSPTRTPSAGSRVVSPPGDPRGPARTPSAASPIVPGGERPGAKRAATEPGMPSPVQPSERRARTSGGPAVEPVDVSALEDLLDQGRLDDASAAYKHMVKRHPTDRNVRAGVELCEGLRALAARDRLEAAQRFEAALEIDPSNERAARELAEMRRQATNERKGLLSRLMGKKE